MCLDFVWASPHWWLALFLTCVAGVIVTTVVAGIFDLGSGPISPLVKAVTHVCVAAMTLSVLGCAVSLIGIAGTLAFGLLT